MTNILLNRKPLEDNCSHLVENERITIGIKTTKGVYSLTQIADKWISHIINRASIGDQLSRGELFGMIRFGSQVDVFIPDELGYTPIVNPGDYVLAGVTTLAMPLVP
jgi:phosphatidylserine decarboxylase